MDFEKMMNVAVSELRDGDIVAFRHDTIANNERDLDVSREFPKGETVKVKSFSFQDEGERWWRVTFDGSDEYTVRESLLRFVNRGVN
jgi:hypothetical protein